MTAKPLVIVTDFITDDLHLERQVLGDTADILALNAYSEEELVGHVEDAGALMVYHNLGVYRQTLERLRGCKLIVRCGVGFDNVDHAFARERGIPVANVPDYGTADVADSAIGLMLGLARGIHYANSRLRAGLGEWSFREVQPLQRLQGRVFAIVGLGRIGTAAALRAKALGMDVAYFDPYKPHGYDRSLGVRHVERFDDLLAEANVLSLHCPLTDETRHMIDAAAIAKMPRGSYLVNTARGAVVDTFAVPAAIASGHLAGAGIDVLAHEPPPDDDPLIVAWRDPAHAAHHRVIVNPHMAFYSEQGLLDMRVKGATTCLRALRGESIPNVINGVPLTAEETRELAAGIASRVNAASSHVKVQAVPVTSMPTRLVHECGTGFLIGQRHFDGNRRGYKPEAQASVFARQVKPQTLHYSLGVAPLLVVEPHASRLDAFAEANWLRLPLHARNHREAWELCQSLISFACRRCATLVSWIDPSTR